MINGTVAIVGRPNVGKSTLFNCMTRSRNALVDDRPGVTRDRIYGTVYFDDYEENGFLLIDTGGFETEGFYYQPFQENIVWRQTELAIAEADLILLVFDGREGLHPHDRELLNYLRKQQKPVLCVVNKIDHTGVIALSYDFYKLGIDPPLLVSASHSKGIDEVLEAIEARFEDLDLHADSRKVSTHDAMRIAIVGRPNAGKSSIINRLLGEERNLVSEVAGTTRDSIDSQIAYNQKSYVLIDTAGIRRRSRIKDKIESLSVMRSMQAVERADIAVLVIDAMQSLTEQDARIADLVASQHKGLLIVVNKWDLIPNKDSKSVAEYTTHVREQLKLLEWVPILFTSALENQRVHRIMQLVETIATDLEKRIETRRVNEALEIMVAEHTPSLIRAHSKRVKFYYATQVKTKPPTIVVFCNVADEIQESYKRYMSNRYRDILQLQYSPLRLIFRGKDQARRAEEEGRS
jgi:GTP-binding protein